MDSDPSSSSHRQLPSSPLADAKRPQDDNASVDSSPRSTHSRGSVDTTHVSGIEDHVDDLPPPAYTPRVSAHEQTFLTPRSIEQRQPRDYGTIRVAPFNVPDRPHPARDLYDGENEDPQSPIVPDRSRTWRRVVKVLSVVVCFAVLASFIATRLTSGRQLPDDDKGMPHGDNSHYLPVWPHCDASGMSDRAATFDFKDVSDFSLIDNIRGRSISPSLDGKVVVMPGDAIQKSDVRVIVSMESTDHDFLDEVSFVQTDNKLAIEVIQAPPVLRGPEGAECTILNVLLLPRPGLILDNFGIMTRHFSVMLMKDLKLSIREQTNVAALGGSVTSLVDAHVFHSTSTRIHTSVGSINGTIPFDESLTLRTTSGDIGMSIQGTSHDGYKPPRANFTASSTSGNINITFPSPPAERLHCAGCNIHVSTTSGSISGHFIQGLHTKLESISGLIDGSIRALDRYPSSIRLNTVSLFNRTTLQVLKPAHSLFESMKNITSYHKSISGDIRVSYPESWEGRLDGSTLSGELLVRGARIERKTSNFISAIHGDGDSKIGFSTVNGNVNITIGTDSS